MNSTGTFLQIQIYTRKFFRTLKKESIISIIIGIIITALVMFVTSDNMFETFEGTKPGFFALICACIWIGIFNSIQLVCREKNDIVKDELDKSLKATAYMAAHFIYQFILCAIQSIIVFIIFVAFLGDKLEGNLFLYMITIFLIMFSSDAMAFVISSAVPNPIVAMTVMPLLLLVQLVMAGVLFQLEGVTEYIAYFTISRWGMAAFGMIGDITSLRSSTHGKVVNAVNDALDNYLPNHEPAEVSRKGFIPETDMNLYDGDTGDIILCWLCFIAFIVAFYFLSVAALKFTTRRLKK